MSKKNFFVLAAILLVITFGILIMLVINKEIALQGNNTAPLPEPTPLEVSLPDKEIREEEPAEDTNHEKQKEEIDEEDLPNLVEKIEKNEQEKIEKFTIEQKDLGGYVYKLFGTVVTGAQQIEVTAKNSEEGILDTYVLKSFKTGDQKRSYNIKPEYDTILPGINTYTIKVSRDDGSTSTYETSIDLTGVDKDAIMLKITDLYDIEYIKYPNPIKMQYVFPLQRITFKNNVPSQSQAGFADIVDKAHNIELEGGVSLKLFIRDNNRLDVTFPAFSKINHTITSHLEGNSRWFSYNFIIVSPTQFYMFDGGGHEGIPQYKYFDGTNLIDFNKILEEKLKEEFADDRHFPQFSLQFTKDYLRFEEENYCCDIFYDFDDTNRKKYRKVFILDRKNLDIIEERLLPR